MTNTALDRIAGRLEESLPLVRRLDDADRIQLHGLLCRILDGKPTS